MTIKDTVATLIKTGFDAVNCAMIPVETDDNGISVRNLFIEFEDDGITCYSVEDWEPKTLFKFPPEAVESTASAVVLKVLTLLVSRAVENRWRDLDTVA